MKKQLQLFLLALLVSVQVNSQTGATLNFDGVNDNVSLGSVITTSLTGSTKVSIEAWVNPSSLSGLGCIIGNYSTGSGNLQILLRRSGNSYYEFWVGNGSFWYNTNSVATPTLNVWQHVAGTWDGTVASIYVNGVLSGTTTPAISTLGNGGNNPVWLGGNTINESFTGNIDGVRIWSTNRSQSEIQATMNCEVLPDAMGLLAAYNFNDGQANGNNAAITTVNDISGNGNIGNLNGFTLLGTTSNFVTDSKGNYISLQSTIGSTAMADRLANGMSIDYNNDGWKDIVVTAENSEVRLYLNNGHGNFSSYTVIHAAGAGSIKDVADMDNDGDRDYILTNTGIVTAYINNGNGTFTAYATNLMNGTGYMATAKIVDINGDTKPDLILGNNNNGATDKNEIWINTGSVGNAAFAFSTSFTNGIYKSSIATGDVDEDGDVDVFFGSNGNGGDLYLNNSNNGTFTPGVTPPGYSGGVQLTDWNQDGHLDMLQYEYYNRCVMIRLGNGTGVYSGPTILFQNTTINNGNFVDINADGYLDFVASHWGGNGYVYLNNGCSYILQTSCEYNLGRADNATTLADFNNDGTLDIFCQARDNKSSIFLNFLSPVTTPALPMITSAANVYSCSGMNSVLTATAMGSGTVEWYNGATGGSPISTSSNYSVMQSTGTYTYYVGAINSNGCKTYVRDLVTLTVNALPTVSVTSGVICAGKSFTMVPSGASTYTYSNGAAVVTPTANASYSVTGTATLTGCSNTAVSNVTVNALPTLTATTNNTLLCVGQQATLSVTGASTYTWSTTGNTASIAVSPTVQTVYSVYGTGANSCSNSTTITQNVSSCTGVNQLSGSGSELSISPNPSNGVFTIQIASMYKVSIYDALGKVVYSEQLLEGKHSINMSDFANGLYLMKAEGNNQTKTFRLIKE